MLPKLMIPILIVMTASITAADYDIKMVHFLPTDRESTLEQRNNIREFSKATQDFYRREMARHGHGNRSFTLDKEVYVVDGKRKANEYASMKALDTDLQHFVDTHGDRHAYLVFIEVEKIPGWGCGVAAGWNNGQGRGDIYGGRAYMAYSNGCLLTTKDRLISHEIGHIFGLQHDLNSSPHTIMALGNQLNRQQTDWLSVSHYFQEHRKFGKAPVLKHQHGVVDKDEDYIITLSVEDTTGLHYAQLWYNNVSFFFKLKGQNDIFVFSAHTHSLIHNKLNLTIIDTDGNSTWYKVPTPIDERHELRTIEVIKKPAAVIAVKLTTKWALIKTQTR